MKSKKKLPKCHSFNGKKYKFLWRRPKGGELGRCDDPTEEAYRRFITVNPHLEKTELVEVILHEAMHAEQWDLSEKAVTRIAENLARLLKRCDLIKN